MGVEDEAEQSTERPCCNERQVQAIGRRGMKKAIVALARRLAICIAQALSHDHLLVRVSMTWAAS